MVQPLAAEQNLQLSDASYNVGTLAIDLGSTTTVVAFQSAERSEVDLLDLDSITREKGAIPSLLWAEDAVSGPALVGLEVMENSLHERDAPQLHRDFKRWIGMASDPQSAERRRPAQAGAQQLCFRL